MKSFGFACNACRHTRAGGVDDRSFRRLDMLWHNLWMNRTCSQPTYNNRNTGTGRQGHWTAGPKLGIPTPQGILRSCDPINMHHKIAGSRRESKQQRLMMSCTDSWRNSRLNISSSSPLPLKTVSSVLCLEWDAEHIIHTQGPILAFKTVCWRVLFLSGYGTPWLILPSTCFTSVVYKCCWTHHISLMGDTPHTWSVVSSHQLGHCKITYMIYV